MTIEIPDANALDLLAREMKKDFSLRLAKLRDLRLRVAKIPHEYNAALMKRFEELKGIAYDDDGNLINEDLAEIFDWFENNSLESQLEESLESIASSIDDAVGNFEGQISELSATIEGSPKKAFKWNREVDEDEDEDDEEIEDEEDLLERVNELKKTGMEADEIRNFQIRELMRLATK